MNSKGMKGFIHTALQRVIKSLMLLYAGQTAKALRRHMGGVMVAIARQIVDPHHRVRNTDTINASMSCALMAMEKSLRQ